MRLIPVTSPTSNETSLGGSCPSWRAERTVGGARGGRTVPCSMTCCGSENRRLVGRPRLTGIRRIKHATAAFSSGSVWRAAEHPGDHRDISGLGERETGAGDPGKAEGIALLTSRSRASSTEPSPHGIDTAVSSKPSGIAWLGDIPSSYTRTRLAECVCRHREDTQSAASSTGNSPPPERAQNHRHEFGTRSDDRTMTPQAYSGLQRSYAVQAGDVVIALVGATTGKSVESLALQRLRRKANPSGHA